MNSRRSRVHGFALPLVLSLFTGILLFSPDVIAQRYHAHTYNEINGLPSSYVRGITQDTLGCMWFATRNGVACYDGLHWIHYNQNDGLGVMANGHILADPAGRMWAVSELSPVLVSWFDGDSWHQLPPGPVSQEAFQVELAAFTAIDGRDFVVTGTSGGKLTWWNGRQWFEIQVGTDQIPDVLRGVEEIDQKLYVATCDGLLILDPLNIEKGFEAVPSLPQGELLGIAHDPAAGHLWLIGRNWIGRLKDEEFELLAEKLEFNLPSTRYQFITELDGEGGIYFGNSIGLYRFHPAAGLEVFETRSGLLADGVTSLCLDREGNLWVGNPRGVTKFVSRLIAGYDIQHGLFDSEVSSILQLRDGRIILGHFGGLTFWDDDKRPVAFGRQPLQARVVDLEEGASGMVWIAASQYGLGRLDRSGKIRWFEMEGELGGMVNAVLADRNGRLWVATAKGLFRFDGDVFSLVDLKTEGASLCPYVRKLFKGSDGAVYAASARWGVFVIRDGGVEQFKHPSFAPANDVFSFLERQNGEIWAGTAGGLYELTGGTLREVAPPGPDIDRPIYFMLEDRLNRTWFGTDNGVLRWDGSSGRSFTALDGLLGTETNRDAGLCDELNRIWIGTNKGLSIYHCDREKELPVPRVQVREIVVGDEIHSLPGPISLKHHQNNIVFRFQVISFVDEKRIRLQSWLEGFDDAWQPYQPFTSSEIRYTNLPPGAYRFHLQATSAQGAQSEEFITPVIVIQQPVWAAVWFRLAALAMLAAAIYWIQYYLTRRRRKAEGEKARMQKLEALGILAGGIAHDFNNHMTVMLGRLSLLELSLAGNEKALQAIEQSNLAISRARALTQQLLTFSKGGEPVLRVAYIQNTIKDASVFALSGGNVSCDLDLPEELWPVEIDEGQMNQVLNNLLINARQAMPDGGIVRIRAINLPSAPASLPEGRWIRIDVEDEGQGIPKRDHERIFDPYYSTKTGGCGLGLAIAHSIVIKHGGRITVESEPGQGAVFSIYLPAPEKVVVEPVVEQYQDLHIKGRILVMDDNSEVRSTIQNILDSIGCDSVGAENGEEAIELFKESLAKGVPFEAVLLDLTVPGGMGGEETAAALKQIEPGVLMIVMSGYANKPVLAAYRDYGFCAQLSKPFSAEDLIHVLSRVMARRAQPV